jgi:hypothetical protein
MSNDEDLALSNADPSPLEDELEGPRVTEIPLVGDYFPLRLPRLDRVNMKDVLWFSPHPPPIESAEIPSDPDEDRPSVAPVAMPVVPLRAEPDKPTRVSRLGASLNPALSLGVLGALIAAAYFVQPQRHGSPIAQLALAFPDRVVIDMTQPPTPVAVEDLPIADQPEIPDAPIPKIDVKLPQAVKTTLRPNLPPVEPPSEIQIAALPPFNAGDALTAIHAAAGSAAGCVPTSGPSTARVSVTFAPNGRVTQATIVSGPLMGTSEGGCVARTLRTARMEPYAGPPVTVHRTIRLR